MAEERDGLAGKARRKLVESKERWAREGRLLTGRAARPEAERLPPGQRRVRPGRCWISASSPTSPASAGGLPSMGWWRPGQWDWASFRAQPAFHDLSDIHCVTAWSRFDNAWDGVSATISSTT